MIGSQSVKAVKISSFARNTIRHALQSGSASGSRANSSNTTTSASQGGSSGTNGSDFFTPAPAPAAPDYSNAFFTSAPAPSAGSALHRTSSYFDPSDRHSEGRAGRGEQRSRNSAGSGWNFHDSGRVAAVHSNSTPAIDAGLLIRADEEEERRGSSLSSNKPRRPSLAARPRSSSASPTAFTSSELIASVNTRQAFQASLRNLIFNNASSQATNFASAGWHFRIAGAGAGVSSRGYATQVDAEVKPSSSPDQQPSVLISSSTQELPPSTTQEATIEELPADEPAAPEATASPETPSAAADAATTSQSPTPHPRRNRVRSSSTPSAPYIRRYKRDPAPEPPEVNAHVEAIQAAESSEAVFRAVEQYQAGSHHSQRGHNAALAALARWHSYDEPVQVILDVFEDMLQRNLKPNVDSYGTVIEVLAQRDQHIQVRLDRTRSELVNAQTSSAAKETPLSSAGHGQSPSTTARQTRSSAADESTTSSSSGNPTANLIRSLRAQLESLSQDDSATAAFQFYKALGLARRKELPQSTVHALLRLCLRHQRGKDAVVIFQTQLQSPSKPLDFEAVSLALQACANVKDLESANKVFAQYLTRTGIQPENDESLHSEAELAVWDDMIGAAFQAGDAHAAVSTFEQLTTLPAANHIKADARLLERMVSGFAVLGDGASTLRWAQRITSDPHYSTHIGLAPSFLARSIILLASRISALDIVATEQACDVYTVMRNFAVATNQPYSGATLQQLITNIIPYTFSTERTSAITQVWDRLAEFVELYHQDVAKHPDVNSYLAPESVALLEKARSSSPPPPPSQSSFPEAEVAHQVHDAHSQAPRESLGSTTSERGSDAFSPARSASTAGTPPYEDVDTHKDFALSPLSHHRPLSPVADYVDPSVFTASAINVPHWDEEVSRAVEKIFKQTKVYDLAGPPAAQIIIDAVHQHRLVSPDLIAETLTRCGRSRNEAMMEQLYLAGYASLSALESDAEAQLAAWHKLENAALIAAANAGLLDRASLHRSRLIEAGGAPTAEAYGTLILNAKDTTDDASVAIDLFEESRSFGVPPNTFLFNNLISRLSKARRTKAVLECFEQMKAAGIPTSSVTYGAVINACCKIGDVSAASFLFEEMTSLIDFVPKVPPYNTMIQFFVSTKPDRERALYYYQRMLKAGVKPSAHTYKLLLDCYGSLKPIDTQSMVDVFKMLEKDNFISIQGTHWAALINSYGLAQNDLEKAIETFESIAGHRKSQRAGLPDAVTYEALLNSCLANNRPDLVEFYSADMQKRSVHSTAYCENARIKAFTRQGNLEAARRVFETLADPPTGVAASGNHPGGRRHNTQQNRASSVSKTDPSAPVFREPSSFEAMIRAEVKMGDPDRAAALVEQARQRAFPAQVIKGLQDYLVAAPPLDQPASTSS